MLLSPIWVRADPTGMVLETRAVLLPNNHFWAPCVDPGLLWAQIYFFWFGPVMQFSCGNNLCSERMVGPGNPGCAAAEQTFLSTCGTS